MDITQPSAKIPMATCTVEPSGFVELFHRWIQSQGDASLLIDVADYRHVHQGPGIVLVAHDFHCTIDDEGGQRGLTYRRRRGAPGPAFDRLREAVDAALEASARLESELGDAVRFERGRLWVGCHDRLRAPNTGDTFDALAPDLERLAARLYPGAEIAIEPAGEPRAPFQALIQGGDDTPLSELRTRLSAAD